MKFNPHWLYAALFVFLACGMVLGMQEAATEAAPAADQGAAEAPATPAENPAPDEEPFDYSALWKGAIAGAIASILRFLGKGKGIKEFDIKYAAMYGVLGVAAGAYAAWRGIETNDALAWAESTGLVLLLYTIIKGGKEGIPTALKGFLSALGSSKKSDGATPPSPPRP